MPMAFLGGSVGGWELLLVLAVALLLFGSKNLPRIARNLGKAMEEFRRAARDVSDEIMHASAGEDSSRNLPEAKVKTDGEVCEDDAGSGEKV